MRDRIPRLRTALSLLLLVIVASACSIGNATSSTSGASTPTPGAGTPPAETPTTHPIPTDTTAAGTPTATPIPCPRSDTPFGAFLHQATASNVTGNYTVLSHALGYCLPNAILLVTPNWNPPGSSGVYNNHPIGVFYITSVKRWAIFNQDFASMPVGAAFNVRVAHQIADAPVCVHTATLATINGQSTRITCETAGDDANSKLFVTSNWNSPGSSVYNNHPIGVYHEGTTWYVFNQDLATIPTNATVNIERNTTARLQTATAGNSSGDYTVIDSPLSNGKPNALLIVTQNWNPGASAGVYNKHTIGVFYTSAGKWAIFNQDRAAMPAGPSFNWYVASS
jgi:hypothetical protein